MIPPHTGLAGIATLLAREGVIRHSLSFELGAILLGRGSALFAGEYEFPAGASSFEAMDLIASSKTVKHRLTIPEGLTSAETLALVRAAPALDGDPGPPPPEGDLMPETYLYSYGEERNEIDIWPVVLTLGATLPVLPLALKGAHALPLDLEATYTDARQRSRL